MGFSKGRRKGDAHDNYSASEGGEGGKKEKVMLAC